MLGLVAPGTVQAQVGDPTLADALLDRLIHNAYRIVMKGESLRRKNTEEEAAS